MRSKLLASAVAVSASLALAPAAHADAIDDALAKLPSGPVSCDQAQRYWTNEADYNSKVSQAQLFARFDRRGDQIREALARVDEAANRCGLKGPNAPAAAAPAAPAAKPAQQAAPAAPAAPAAQAAKPNQVQIAGFGTVTIPDFQALIRDAIKRLLTFLRVHIPGFN